MTDPELLQRARDAGIATSYENWRHVCVEVPAETLTAILAALDRVGTAGAVEARKAGEVGQVDGAIEANDAAEASDAIETSEASEAPEPAEPAGGARPGRRRPRPGLGRPRPVVPDERRWGFTVQLYSVRSRQSWGHGDLHDLGELARYSGADLGARFVLVNPLHAAEPRPPISASPYLPMTRLFTSPLYIRVEDIAEYVQLPPSDKEGIARLAEPLRAANNTTSLIDRNAVWLAKRQALELISKVPLSAERRAGYDAFRAERGTDLQLWAAWCALAERHGPDWRDWPAGIATPRGGLAAVRDGPLKLAAEFHCWLQWHADEQLATAQRTAKAAGMTHGIIHDLAVGVHPGGADAWAYQDLLVPGFSVGAPPDGFNQLGQDWAQPPWHPRQLARAGYRPLADLFDAALRHGGGLRVDHVMGLMRLWWVPAGQTPDRGAYVSYDHRASVAALAGAAARAGAVAIGEDLGTVDGWIRRYLADHQILGTMMLWFATDRRGVPLPPRRWRRSCMATVGTHDVPPVSGFVTGDQVSVRANLGLLKIPEEQERAESASRLSRWRTALDREGLLAAGEPADPGEFTVACYRYLARTPALLVGVSLADAVGDIRTQNIPGTSEEYPNWQIPLCDARGGSVLIEDLPDSKLARAVCEAVATGLRGAE
jgi:4-alpha-glucanotransferase